MSVRKENEMFIGHIQDLAARSFQNNIYTFTNFLDQAQLSLVSAMEKDLSYAGMSLFGGTEYADRCVARFGKESELGYSQPFPIVCLQVVPAVEKFGEELSHRDYLGALMNLGVERDLLGDIYVYGKTAWVFCLSHIAEYIRQNLVSVRHINVSVSILEDIPESVGPVLEDRTVICASERLDAIVARTYDLSRSQSLSLFTQGKVYINGKQILNNSVPCHPGDRISVRGFGKIIYVGVDGQTGKGRFRIRIRVYK